MPAPNSLIATIPDNHTLREGKFNDDGSSAAFITTHESRYWVTNTNGVRAVYDCAEQLVVSANGKTSAHTARERGRAFVPINGRFDHSFDWVGPPVVRADGLSVAYWGLHRDPSVNAPGYGRYFVVLDGQLIGPFKTNGRIAYHPTDGGLVFSASRDGFSFMSIGGDEGPGFDFIYWPKFNRLDGSVWYWGRSATKYILTRNHEVICHSDEIPSSPGPFFSQGGKDTFYWRCEGNRWHAVRNGVDVGTAVGIVDSVPEISVNSVGDVVYAEKENGDVFVTIAGDRGEAFDAVGPCAFSRVGGKVGYLARRGDKQFVVVDAKLGKPYDVIWPEEGELADYLTEAPTFSHNGSSIAYQARLGDQEGVVVDHEIGELFTCISGQPRFSHTTDTLVYGAISDPIEEYVVIGTKRLGPFKRVWTPVEPTGLSILWIPKFSDPGDKTMFGSLHDNILTWRSVDI